MKSIIVLLTLLCLHQGQRVKGAGGCPEGFTKSQNTDRCYFISKHVATFEVAKKRCESRNSQLAPVYKCEEQVDLSATLARLRWKCYPKKNCMEFWIYLSLHSVKGDTGDDWKIWKISGITLIDEHQFWSRGFPKGNGSCAYMSFKDHFKRGTWRNDDCNRQLKYVCTTCPNNFTFAHETNECFYLNTVKKNWDDARTACTELRPGAQIVTIKDWSKMASVGGFLLNQFFPKGQRDNRSCFLEGRSKVPTVVWIGGQAKDPKCDSTFAWKPIGLDETPFNYTMWAPGMPGCNTSTDFCVRIGSGYVETFDWFNVPCDEVLCSICEFQ